MACCSSCARTGGTCGGSKAPSFAQLFGATFGDDVAPLGNYCGQPYAERVAASGGRTAAKKCLPSWDNTLFGMECLVEDGRAWAASARALFIDVRASWNQLITAENKLQDWAASRSIGEYVEAYEQDYENVSGEWSRTYAQNYIAIVEKWLANVKRGTCALDLINQAAEKVAKKGGNIVPVPKPHGGDAGPAGSLWPWIVGAIVLVGLGAGGGILGASEARRRGLW